MKALLPASRRKCAGVLLAAATIAVSVGCTSPGDEDSGESASSCVFLVEYDNRSYSDVANIDYTVGDKLGTATRPPCDDTPNDDTDGQTAPTSTIAYAVEGLDPSIAIAVGETPTDTHLVAVYSGNEPPPEIKELIKTS